MRGDLISQGVRENDGLLSFVDERITALLQEEEVRMKNSKESGKAAEGLINTNKK